MSYHQTIYNLLRGYGLSEAGALGMLGNWECESGCEPYRVQGDYQASRAISKAYVAAIEGGLSTREKFATDQKGFGLAQWTYPQRKRNLWDEWKKSPYQIDSVELQVYFAMWELRQPEWAGDSTLLELLETSNDILTCTDRICRKYERPAVNNVDARYQAALRIRREIDLSGSTTSQPEEPSDSAAPGADPVQEPEPSQPKLETWPPRVIDSHCSGWPEVWLLQALLKNHGLNVLVDGIFGDALSNKVRQWQRDNGLTPDGAVGPMSWTSLGISPEAFKK